MSVTTAQPLLKRADVPREQTWNRESLFASWDAFQQEFEAIAAQLPEFSKYAGTLGSSPDVLLAWLEAYTQLRRRVYRMMVYTRMATAVDTHDEDAKAKEGQVSSLIGRLNAAAAFAEPEILTLGEKVLEWAQQDERLTPYTHYFKNLLRLKQYKQSPDVEKVLGMLQDPFSGTFRTYHALVDTDMKFPDALDSQDNPHTVAQAIVPPIGVDSTDRTLRRNAWQSFCDQHRAMENTLASNLITSVKQNVFLARVRGYDSVLASRLSPANLPIEVFHTLVNTFKANLPIWHRYWAAKGKALGVDQMHPWDIWAPLVDEPPQISYQQAVEWICASLEPLGQDYVSALRRGALEERWVDWAQNEGRGQGAFSSPAYDSYPFVFNTFDGSLKAASVLAHELGHSMHNYNMSRNQPEIYNGFMASGASSSVSETASNFHQAMLRAYLMNAKADDRTFQLTLIDEAMFNFHRYFFIMPTLARFEYEVYCRAEKDQPLNAAILNGIMRDFYAEGYGDTLADDPDRTAITWGEFLHLYMPFYTFQYSVGISAAHALAEGILAGNDGAVERYLGFLSAGWSQYAPDLFRQAGVDMTQPEPIEKTFGVLAKLVERLESLVEG
jgi:oligoendopeptidase F